MSDPVFVYTDICIYMRVSVYGTDIRWPFASVQNIFMGIVPI